MANPASKYQDPEKIPLNDLRTAVKALQDLRLAYSSAGQWRAFPKDIAAQLKRAEIVLARREGEPHGTLRTAAVLAAAPARGIASLAGLPGDIYQLGKTGMSLIPGLAEANRRAEQYFPPARAVGTLGEFVGERLPTSQQIQQALTNAPTLLGGKPLLTPETSGQKLLDQSVQGAAAALAPVGLAAQGTRIPVITPTAATMGAQGLAKTAVKEGAAGTAGNLAAEVVHQQTEHLAPAQQKWAAIPQVLAGFAAGHPASGLGGEAFDLLQRARTQPGWSISNERFLHSLGMKFQELLNRGTPQDIAMREVARAIREEGGDTFDKFQRAFYLTGLAPDPTTPAQTRYIDRPAPAEFDPTLGQVLDVPFLKHLETSANPELAPHIRQLRADQATGKEAVINAIHEEGGIPYPQGDTTLTHAAEAGNVTVPVEGVAGAAYPRYAAENLDLQRATSTELAGLSAAEEAAQAQAQAQKDAIAALEPQNREAIIQEELRRKDAREAQARQTIRSAEERAARVLEMQRMRLKAEAEQQLKAAEDIVTGQVGKLEGPRDIDVQYRGGYDLRQNLVQQYENVQADASQRYGKIRAEAQGLKAPNPAFMQDVQQMRDSAIIAQRADPNFPAEAVDQFYDAIIKRKSLEEEALAQATPGYKPKTPREIAATITDADLEVGDYTQLRSNLLRWQRYNGATYYSKELTRMADEGMEKLMTDHGRPELAQRVRETNAWYRKEITPFSTGVGEELLRLHHTAIPTEITYLDTLTGQPVTKTIQFQVPLSDTVARVLDDPTRERLQSLLQATGGQRQTQAAVEEMLAHRLYSRYGGAVRHLTPEQLDTFRRENRTMFALLNEFGMGQTGKKFADIQSARSRMAEVEAQHSAEVQRERLHKLENYEKQHTEQVKEQANREKLAQQYQDEASIRAMEDAQKMTEVQSLRAIEQAETGRLQQINEQRQAFVQGHKQHEQQLLAKYLVPHTITPENPLGDVAAHMAGLLTNTEPKQLLANVMRLKHAVRGDAAAEAAVGNALTAELWRRSRGNAPAFRQQLSQNRRALHAAGANERGIRVLEEQGEMLEMLQRSFASDVMKGMSEREKLLFRGRTTQQRVAQMLNFFGGIIGANWGAKFMYEPGAHKTVTMTGIGAFGGRAAGGPITRFLGGLAMRPSADAFNANTAQAVYDMVFRPDLQEAFFAYMHNPTPKNKARLRSFYITMGLPQREGYYGPTSPEGAITEEPQPAAVPEVPQSAPEPFPTEPETALPLP